MIEQALKPASLQDLKAHLHGELICPDNRSYDASRTVWNGMIEKYPAVIVYCADVADVVHAVQFARDSHLLVAVRGGGHRARRQEFERTLSQTIPAFWDGFFSSLRLCFESETRQAPAMTATKPANGSTSSIVDTMTARVSLPACASKRTWTNIVCHIQRDKQDPKKGNTGSCSLKRSGKDKSSRFPPPS